MTHTGSAKRYDTANATFEHTIGTFELSSNYKLCAPSPMPTCLAILFWDKYNERAFARVSETRVEVNYPIMWLPNCLCDQIKSTYHDDVGAEWVRASNCTPYHLCFFVEIQGQVAATAMHPACNNCLCGMIGCRTYVPGLQDAQSFCNVANSARETFKKGFRSAPKVQIMQ